MLRISNMIGRAVWLAVLLTCGSAAGEAAAQQASDGPSDTEIAMARDLFQTGVAHTRAEEWEQAREAFERSYGVAAVPVTLLNLASAQAHTGQIVAGIESYRRFLATVGDARRARAMRDAAEQAITSLEPRIGHLLLDVPWLDYDDVLLLNGSPLAHAALGAEIPVDPGALTVSVERRGNVVASREMTVTEGQQLQVAFDPPAPVAVAPMPAELAAQEQTARDAEAAQARRTAERDEDGGGVLRSPWLWAGVGAVVVGAIVTGVVVANSGSPTPYQGNVGPGSLGFE